MSSDHKVGKNIWDVIFSLDKHHFPIQRNYLQEPRGSNNPINSQVTQEACQETVDYVRKNITDPNDLYVLDFELNYMIRKLADFILFCSLDEFSPWDDFEFPPLEDMVGVLENYYKWDEGFLCCNDIKSEAELLAYERDKLKNGICDYAEYSNVEKASRLQQAVQYVIEHSDFDWKTRAEAFLRASSNRGYSPADDETIIYLMSQNIDDDHLEKEAQHRWERYKREWGYLFFTEKNPFEGKFSVDRLRLVHWDKLSKLRLLEPQMLKAEYMNNKKLLQKEPNSWKIYDHRGTYNYNVEAQHLLSPQFLADYVKVFSLIRTDLDVDPIRSYHRKLIGKFYSFLSGSRDFEYNYTVTDIHYLSDLLYTFTRYRFQLSPASKDDRSYFGYKTRGHIELLFGLSTSKFLTDIPMTTLIALEVHAVYYSRPKGMIDFLQKAKQWLLSQQTPYGYWYDGVNNPEYTTVLVLDALTLIDGEDGLTFPKETIPLYDESIIEATPLSSLLVNYASRSLFVGSNETSFKFRGGVNKTWDFIKALITARQVRVPLPRYLWTRVDDDNDDIPEVDKKKRHDWKNQYDTLSRQLGGPEIIKRFIISTGDSYDFSENVVFTSHSTVRYKADSNLMAKL